MKRLVIIESPFAGDFNLNNAYLDACLSDSYSRGEAPIASHAIGPRCLDESNPSDRETGIDAGLAWYQVADAVAFYVDHGLSGGMLDALCHYCAAASSCGKRDRSKHQLGLSIRTISSPISDRVFLVVGAFNHLPFGKRYGCRLYASNGPDGVSLEMRHTEMRHTIWTMEG